MGLWPPFNRSYDQNLSTILQSQQPGAVSVGTTTTAARAEAIDLENSSSSNEALPLPARARSQTSRRQSISLNAVINHRRALLGAFLTRVGSNISLPSCVPQDQDLSANLTYSEPMTSNSPPKPILLQLTPVNTTAAPLTNLDAPKEKPMKTKLDTCHTNRHWQQQYSELMSSISTLYANLLVVVGVAVPVTASVSQQVPSALNQGFYLYLYLASVVFVVTMYGTLVRDKALKKMIAKHVRQESTYAFAENGGNGVSIRDFQLDEYTQSCGSHSDPDTRTILDQPTQHYGSFCLRLGTVGFGAGSLVFTGLQIGAELASEPLRACVPGARLLLVTAQMHFIFLNSKDLAFTRREAFAKLGLMHLIATNICEWLKALVEETRCEIVQLGRAHEGDASPVNNSASNDSGAIGASGGGIHRKLLRDASPFLFPCTIEFSLICAVILYEMWRRVDERLPLAPPSSQPLSVRSSHQLSIDCASAHRGLFGGVLVVAATVLSLIMFFVLKEAKPKMAVQQVTSLEVAIQISGTVAAVGGALKLRRLEHRNMKPPHLDSTLLAAAQAGVYLHSMFGAVGSILTQGPTWTICLAADFLALLQSTLQTVLIKMAWRRRSRSSEKPGKELVTFLIVVNIAMWTVNTLEKSRAGVRPDHLEFFGVWAWTIITHVSMPLAIFYRFHSAICLFEVWKSCYKYRPLISVS